MTGPTTLDVLRGARRILLDGGDPEPCEAGQWCPYCCAGIAKTDLDGAHGTGRDAIEALEFIMIRATSGYAKLRDSDKPLTDASELIRDAGAMGLATFSREQALEIVDAAILAAERIKK